MISVGFLTHVGGRLSCELFAEVLVHADLRGTFGFGVVGLDSLGVSEILCLGTLCSMFAFL